MLDNLTVRLLNEKDLKKVRQMDDMSGNYVQEWLDENEDFAWGIFLKDKLIGYCTTGCADCDKETFGDYDGFSDDAIILSNVYVRRVFRGRGIATKMINEVLDKRNPNDEECVFLTVLYDDLYRFYSKLGFKWLDESESYAMVKDRNNGGK